MKGIGGNFSSEPDLTTADKRIWKNAGYPPGFTVDELRFYRRKRAPGDFQQNDHLTLESGDFKQLKSEYRRRFRDYYDAQTRSALLYDLKDLSPSRPNKPDDHLMLDGDDEDEDVHARVKREFQPEYHASFIEFPIEQRAAAASVSTFRRYKRHMDAMPPEDVRSFGAHKSENHAQYIRHDYADRTRPIRRSTSLKLDGDFTPTTEKTEQFINYLLQKRRSLKRVPSTLRLEGAMENKKTETRDKYVPFDVQPRAVLQKKLTNLRLEGDLDITTENHEQFVPFAADPGDIRPPLVKRSTNLRLEGDLRMSPEYRHEYVEHPGSERSSPSFPRHNLTVDGFFDGVTENQEKFVGHTIHPPIPFLRGDAISRKLLLGDDKYVSRGEYREKFIPHNVQKIRTDMNTNGRGQNLSLEGDFESETENRHAFVEHRYGTRPDGARRMTNLQLEGEINMNPEYRNAYVDFYKSGFSSPERRRQVEGSLRSEGVMDTRPEYKHSYVDFPRQRPSFRRPQETLSSEGEMDHMTEKRAQFIEYPGHRAPDAMKREPEFKLEGEFVCQPEYRKAYVNYLIRERVDHKHRPLDNLNGGAAAMLPSRAFEILNTDSKNSTTSMSTTTTTTGGNTATTSTPLTSTTDTKLQPIKEAKIGSMIPVANRNLSTPSSSSPSVTTGIKAETLYATSTNTRIPRRLPSINTLETQLFGPKIEPPKTLRSRSSSRLTSRSPSPRPPHSSRTRSLTRTAKHSKGSSSEPEEKHRDRTGSRFHKSVRVEDLAYTPATSPIPTHKLYKINYADRKKWDKPSESAKINEQIDRMTAFMVIDDENNNNESDFTDRNSPTRFYKEQKWMSSWNSPIK